MVDVIVVPPPVVEVSVNPAATPVTPPTEVTVLEGQPGPKGEKGEPGVASVVAPLVLDDENNILSINESQIQIAATQVSGLPAATSYTHNQSMLSSIWTITHNLGFYPSVTTQDSAGSVIEGTVAYPSPTTVTVDFSVETSGVAYLS